MHASIGWPKSRRRRRRSTRFSLSEAKSTFAAKTRLGARPPITRWPPAGPIGASNERAACRGSSHVFAGLSWGASLRQEFTCTSRGRRATCHLQQPVRAEKLLEGHARRAALASSSAKDNTYVTRANIALVCLVAPNLAVSFQMARNARRSRDARRLLLLLMLLLFLFFLFVFGRRRRPLAANSAFALFQAL